MGPRIWSCVVAQIVAAKSGGGQQNDTLYNHPKKHWWDKKGILTRPLNLYTKFEGAQWTNQGYILIPAWMLVIQASANLPSNAPRNLTGSKEKHLNCEGVSLWCKFANNLSTVSRQTMHWPISRPLVFPTCNKQAAKPPGAQPRSKKRLCFCQG